MLVLSERLSGENIKFDKLSSPYLLSLDFLNSLNFSLVFHLAKGTSLMLWVALFIFDKMKISYPLLLKPEKIS